MAIPENGSVVDDGGQPAPPGWVERTAFDYTAMANPQAGSTWDGNARVYSWSDEYGDVGPQIAELEVELFGSPEDRDQRIGGGLDFSASVLPLDATYAC